MLRRQARQTGRDDHRDPGGHPPTLEGDPDRAGEVHLPSDGRAVLLRSSRHRGERHNAALSRRQAERRAHLDPRGYPGGRSEAVRSSLILAITEDVSVIAQSRQRRSGSTSATSSPQIWSSLATFCRDPAKSSSGLRVFPLPCSLISMAFARSRRRFCHEALKTRPHTEGLHSRKRKAEEPSFSQIGLTGRSLGIVALPAKAR